MAERRRIKGIMMEITEKNRKQQLDKILKEELIHPVYQPIISLVNGEMEGYEALSRIDLPDCDFNVEEMFLIAEEANRLWELEELCRRKSIENAINKPEGAKLFLNVAPQVIRDSKFKEGMTCRYLKQFGLRPTDLVLEITEHSAIQDKETFVETVEHYKKQDFKIAIDDFGNGYAGLNRICALSPQYLKIDMGVVKNVDKDKLKQSLVESFVIFCKNSGIRLIAEGIETEKELEELIRLGVNLGQGYYIQRPARKMYDIPVIVKNDISKHNLQHHKILYRPSFWDKVGTIIHEQTSVNKKEAAEKMYEYLKENREISEICVVDDENHVAGILTRRKVLEVFGGRYGFNLHARDTVERIMDKNALIIDSETSIENVSKMALSRPPLSIYDAVIVTEKETYAGVVTVKDLLETAISIQVSRAMDANPLTGLPGNSVIQEKINRSITGEQNYAIIYFDLDNFKAYNDAYGFQNGDLMIKALAICMQQTCRNQEFIGHIGGDDMVIITDTVEVEEMCTEIMEKFQSTIRGLYKEEDLKRGYIISPNRKGIMEEFPIATVSVAAVTNRKQSWDAERFSEKIAEMKEQAKEKQGNSFVAV